MRARRRTLAIVATAVTLPLVTATLAFAAITVTFEVIQRPNKASTEKEVRPITVGLDFTIGDDTGNQPSPLRKAVIHHVDANAFFGSLFPRCKLAALLRGGPAACPARSRVGGGTATGSARPLVDSVSAKLTFFNGEVRNGKPTLLIYVQPDLGPFFTIVDVITRGSDGTYTDTVEIPRIPTIPGQPDAATTSVHVRTLNVFAKKKVRQRISGKRVTRTVKLPYIGAPRTCNGRWTYTGEFTFESGETIKLSSAQPCTKK